MQDYGQAEYKRVLPLIAQVILDGRDHPELTEAQFSQYVSDLDQLIPANLKKEVIYFADSKNRAGLDANKFFACFDIYFNDEKKLTYTPDILSRKFQGYFTLFSEDMVLPPHVRLQKNIIAYEAAVAEAKRVYSEGLGLKNSETQLADWNWDVVNQHHLLVSHQIDAVMGYVLQQKKPEMRAHYHPSIALPQSSNVALTQPSYANGLLFTRNFSRPIFIPVNPGGHWTQLVIDEEDKMHYADSLSGGDFKKAALAKRLKAVFPDFSCTEEDIVCTGEQKTGWPCGYYVIRKNLMDMGVTDHPIVSAKTEEEMRDAVFEVIAQITGKPCPAHLKEPQTAKVDLGSKLPKSEKSSKWTEPQIKQVRETFVEIFEHEDDETKKVKKVVLEDNTVKTTDLSSSNLEQFVIKALALQAALIKAGVIKEGPVVIDAPTPEKLQELIKLCQKYKLDFKTESKQKSKGPDKIEEPEESEEIGAEKAKDPGSPKGVDSGSDAESDKDKTSSKSPRPGKKPYDGVD